MKTAEQLAKRFRELFLNGQWIAGTNFKTLLSDVNFEQAITEVLALNTIYKLTFHINYYIEGVIHVFEGGPLDIKDKFSFNCPQITSEADWDAMTARLLHNAEVFASHIEMMSENQLKTTFVDEKYGTYQRNIEGLIEHSYYHFGQLSLIKKIVTK